MLKQKTLNLIRNEETNFKKIFSICIPKAYIHQRRFINYIGQYNHWDTNVKEGTLLLDTKKFNVEYIGTTSTSDNYWYSSELESVIPDEYVELMIQTRKKLQELNIDSLANGKIELGGDINGYNLSMIYMAFAPIDTAYFNGSGDTSIYMFVKDLPNEIFERITNVEFPNVVMEIISTFNVEHKLIVKALASEFDYKYRDDGNNIIVTFSEKSELIFKFEGEYLKEVTGSLA